MLAIDKHFLGLFFGAMFLIPTASFAEIKCECRYFGNYVPVGSQICMNTPNGARMAKCEMMQNNPTWQFEEEECPLASNQNMSIKPLLEFKLASHSFDISKL